MKCKGIYIVYTFKVFSKLFLKMYIFYYYLCFMKDNQVLIKLSEDEKKAFKKAAELSGIGFSAWARQQLRAAAIKDLNAAGIEVDFLKTPTNGKS